MEGHKDLPGLWIDETEGANFWLNILTELKSRGVKEIFIACIDGLKGFLVAINIVFPKTEIQLCIIHQIGNTLKYVASKNQKKFIQNLREVYQAPSEETALISLISYEKIGAVDILLL